MSQRISHTTDLVVCRLVCVRCRHRVGGAGELCHRQEVARTVISIGCGPAECVGLRQQQARSRVPRERYGLLLGFVERVDAARHVAEAAERDAT